jgi:glucose/mannose transport system substrate-binding protein
MLDDFRQNHSDVQLQESQYDNLRLQVKSRILRQDPPDIWTGWPGGELRKYVDAGVAADITDLWKRTGMDRQMRSVAADTVSVDGSVHAIPVAIHRVNDLYLHTEAVEEAGIDPSSASDPAELAEVLRQAAKETDGVGLLLPMSDPFTVLQLWEVVLLGMADHRTYKEITDGNAAANRRAIQRALDILVEYNEITPEDSLYHSMVDANEQFMDGQSPVYPQGDWAGGVFVEEDGFEFGRDWDRIAFPGTERMYGVVEDSFIPSAQSESDGLETFLEHLGSTGPQAEFNRLKGSIPARSDASVDGFSEFGRSQAQAMDRSTEQPQSITHGLATTPAQLINLKSAIASFVDTMDVDATTDEMVDIFEQ